MTITFEAKFVHCSEAIGGELLQVTFDSVDLKDEELRKTPYVLLGQSFEFPSPPTIEWHDGNEYDGGGIQSILLFRNAVRIVTDTGTGFGITFSISNDLYSKLVEYLRGIFPRIEIADNP